MRGPCPCCSQVPGQLCGTLALLQALLSPPTPTPWKAACLFLLNSGVSTAVRQTDGQ